MALKSVSMSATGFWKPSSTIALINLISLSSIAEKRSNSPSGRAKYHSQSAPNDGEEFRVIILSSNNDLKSPQYSSSYTKKLLLISISVVFSLCQKPTTSIDVCSVAIVRASSNNINWYASQNLGFLSPPEADAGGSPRNRNNASKRHLPAQVYWNKYPHRIGRSLWAPRIQ